MSCRPTLGPVTDDCLSWHFLFCILFLPVFLFPPRSSTFFIFSAPTRSTLFTSCRVQHHHQPASKQASKQSSLRPAHLAPHHLACTIESQPCRSNSAVLAASIRDLKPRSHRLSFGRSIRVVPTIFSIIFSLPWHGGSRTGLARNRSCRSPSAAPPPQVLAASQLNHPSILLLGQLGTIAHAALFFLRNMRLWRYKEQRHGCCCCIFFPADCSRPSLFSSARGTIRSVT